MAEMAELAAYRISQPEIMLIPRPNVIPFTAVMMGYGACSMADIQPWNRR